MSDNAQAMPATADRPRAARSAAPDDSARPILLDVENLKVGFTDRSGDVHLAVEDVSFEVREGETLAIVGESGSGKSVTAMALLGLLPAGSARVLGGTAAFEGDDLLALSPRELGRRRGLKIGTVFQEPMTALNPVLRVGDQIAEAVEIHRRATGLRSSARSKALDLMKRVGIPQPEERYAAYPHQYSGGMRQRVVISMAVANEPRLLIADEPTTALDVTIQAQVLELLRKTQHESGASMILITHDLGVVAEMADRVVVMYSGRTVESGTVETVFRSPQHPYTRGLLRSMPRIDAETPRLETIPGTPPAIDARPAGCAFHPRCPLASKELGCFDVVPAAQVVPTGVVSCHAITKEQPDAD